MIQPGTLCLIVDPDGSLGMEAGKVVETISPAGACQTCSRPAHRIRFLDGTVRDRPVIGCEKYLRPITPPSAGISERNDMDVSAFKEEELLSISEDLMQAVESRRIWARVNGPTSEGLEQLRRMDVNLKFIKALLAEIRARENARENVKAAVQ